MKGCLQLNAAFTKAMKKIVTFGEIMLRLSPDGASRLFQNDRMKAGFGGAEANVAMSLARLGCESVYVTKLPENELGNAVLTQLRSFGVSTSEIVRGGKRLGIYFLEGSASVRASSCVYDREGSAIATAKSDDFDWDKILDGADIFHISGITPSLNPTLCEIALDACKTAKRKGVAVSFDPNYRAKLLTLEDASQLFSKFAELSDILIVNENQAQKLFGIEIPENYCNKDADEISDEGYLHLAKALSYRFGCKMIALTERRTLSAAKNKVSAKLYDGEKLYPSRNYTLDIVDRIGAGDAFAAGLLYSVANGKSKKEAVEFAMAAGAIKHTFEGDVNLAYKEEILSLSEGESAAVKR